MSDLIIKTKAGELEYNFSELNQELDIQLAKYTGLVFDENQIKDAKKIRAGLNETKKELNDKKIAVKKEFIKPYTDFENKVKKVITKIDKVSIGIDKQIKSFEEEEKLAKYNLLKEYFDSYDTKYINFDLIFNPKWLNKSVSELDARKQIIAIMDRIKSDLKAIDSNSQSDLLKAIYLKSLDLSEATSELNSINDSKAVAKANEDIINLDIGKTVVDDDTGEIVAADEEYITRSFKATTTIKQMNMLVNFMKDNSIYFEKGENK